MGCSRNNCVHRGENHHALIMPIATISVNGRQEVASRPSAKPRRAEVGELTRERQPLGERIDALSAAGLVVGVISEVSHLRSPLNSSSPVPQARQFAILA
jgi:hypothetical protein